MKTKKVVQTAEQEQQLLQDCVSHLLAAYNSLASIEDPEDYFVELLDRIETVEQDVNGCIGENKQKA